MDSTTPSYKCFSLKDKQDISESLYRSILGKIPDLKAPFEVRWADEEDLFCRTKSIKLRPFKSQKFFDTRISPEIEYVKKLEDEIHYGRQSRLGRGSCEPNECPSSSGHIAKSTNRSQIEAVNKRLEAMRETETKKAPDHSNIKISYRLEMETKRRLKLELRKRLLDEYSKLKIIRRNSDEFNTNGPEKINTLKNNNSDCEDDARKINNDGRDDLSDDFNVCENLNLNDLRKLMTNITDEAIDWQMITSKRPKNEIELQFVNKLIYLHRLQNKTRLEFDSIDRIDFINVEKNIKNKKNEHKANNLSNKRTNIKASAPFVHKRHRQMLRFDSKNNISTKLLEKIHDSFELDSDEEQQDSNLNIEMPSLMITSSEDTALIKETSASSSASHPSKHTKNLIAVTLATPITDSFVNQVTTSKTQAASSVEGDFNYEQFSRFNSKNKILYAKYLKSVNQRRKSQQITSQAILNGSVLPVQRNSSSLIKLKTGRSEKSQLDNLNDLVYRLQVD